jgi:hypothetical protein
VGVALETSRINVFVSELSGWSKERENEPEINNEKSASHVFGEIGRGRQGDRMLL